MSIDPQTTPAAGATRPSAVTVPATPRTPPVYEPAEAQTVLRADAAPSSGSATAATRVRGPVEVPAGDATVLRAPTPVFTEAAGAASIGAASASTSPTAGTSSTAAAPAERSRKGLWIALSAAVLVVLAAVIVGVSLPGILGGGTAQPTPVTSSDPKDPVSAIVPEPEGLTGTVAADGVLFVWTNPDPQEGDRYLVGVVARPDEEPEFEPITETEVTVPPDASGTTCVEVLLVRENGQSSDPVRGCAP